MTINRSSEELAMRDLVVPELRRRWPTARIIHELPTRYSSNRIDLAAVTEQDIVTVEIKSSRDVLDRLEAQLRAFFPISTRMYVAVAPKWSDELPIISRVSQQIGVWVCDAVAGKLDAPDYQFHYRRPMHRPWSERLLQILHVSELCRIAERHCIAVGKRPTHTYLVSACHDYMRGPEIVRAVCRALRERRAFCAGTDAPITEQAAA